MNANINISFLQIDIIYLFRHLLRVFDLILCLCFSVHQSDEQSLFLPVSFSVMKYWVLGIIVERKAADMTIPIPQKPTFVMKFRFFIF